MLVLWAITPIIASQVVRAPEWAAVVCFFVTIAYWSLLYIAREIDQPFGSDDNDLPIKDMQVDFNRSLLELLDPRAQHPPEYAFDPSSLSRQATDNCKSSEYVLTPKAQGDKRQKPMLRLTSRSGTNDSLDPYGANRSGIGALTSPAMVIREGLSSAAADLGLARRSSNDSSRG